MDSTHNTGNDSNLTVLGEYTEFNASMVCDILATNGIEARTIGSSEGQPYQFVTVKVVVRQADLDQALEVMRHYDIGRKIDRDQITASTARGKLWLTLCFVIAVAVIVCVVAYFALCGGDGIA